MVDFNNIGIKELKNYIISTIVNGYDEDFYLNYIKNVVMLESFLKLNNCTYTFYRSLGWNNDDNNFDIGNSLPIKLNQQTNKFYSDDRCRFKFLDDNTLGINGHSLSTMYLDNKKENWVSENNSHPNINVIQDFSSKLSTFIKHQNVGF